MEWIKLTEDNRPNFDQTVFLMEKRIDESKSVVDCGSLISINASGLQWKTSSNQYSFFGGSNNLKQLFTPTHYCEITIPED